MNHHSNRMASNALDQDGLGTTHTPSTQQHLVVETRTDDRWRVIMCTTLDELDQAMDMACALRADPEIDEVCLTLETTGSHGREVRREIIRFGHDGRPENFRIATGHHEKQAAPPPQQMQTPQVSRATHEPVRQSRADQDLGPVLQSTKVPDYEVDEAILDALRPIRNLTPPQPQPIHVPVDDPSESETRASARQIVQSLYGLSDQDIVTNATGTPAPIEESVHVLTEEEIIDFSGIQQMSDDVKRKRNPDAERDAVSEIEAGEAVAMSVPVTDRIQGTKNTTDHPGQRLAAETRPKPAMSAPERSERPLAGDPSGAATKAFIVAGTLAMMVLGGALAELLAVDPTSSAMADQVSAYTDSQ